MLKEACAANDNAKINEVLSKITGIDNIHNDIMDCIGHYDSVKFRNLIHTMYVNSTYLAYLKNVLAIVSALKVSNAEFEHSDEVKEMKQVLEELLPTKTDEFSLVLGTNIDSGTDSELLLDHVAKTYIEIATKVYKEDGIYVSSIISPVRAAYHVDWGCPAYGEKCFEIKGTRNVEFIKDSEAFKAAVYKIVNALRAYYNQNTVTLRFLEVHMDYLVKRND